MRTKEFFEKCQNFDWFYEMSDDHRIWQNGERNKSYLKSLCENNPLFLRIWTDWQNYKYSGSSFGTIKLSVPALENYIGDEE